MSISNSELPPITHALLPEGLEGYDEAPTPDTDVLLNSRAVAAEQPDDLLSRVSLLAAKIQRAPYAVLNTVSELQEHRQQRLSALPEVEGSRARRVWERFRRDPVTILGLGALAAGVAVVTARGWETTHHGLLDSSSLDAMHAPSGTAAAHTNVMQPGASGGAHRQVSEVLSGSVRRQWIDTDASGLHFSPTKGGDIRVTFDSQGLSGKPDLQLMVSDTHGDKALLELRRGAHGQYSQVVDGDSVFGHALKRNDQQYAEVVSRGQTTHGTTDLRVYSTQEGSGTANIPDKPAVFTAGQGETTPPRPRTPDETGMAPAPAETPRLTPRPIETPTPSPEVTTTPSPVPEVTQKPHTDAPTTEASKHGEVRALAAVLAAGTISMLSSWVSGTFLYARRRQQLMGNTFKENVAAAQRTAISARRSAVTFAAGAIGGAAGFFAGEALKPVVAAPGLVAAIGVVAPFFRRGLLGRAMPDREIVRAASAGLVTHPYKEVVRIERAVLKQNVMGVHVDAEQRLRTGGFILPPTEIAKRAENLAALDDESFVTMLYDLRSAREVSVADKLLGRAAAIPDIEETTKVKLQERQATLRRIWLEGRHYRNQPRDFRSPAPTPDSTPGESPAPPLSPVTGELVFSHDRDRMERGPGKGFEGVRVGPHGRELSQRTQAALRQPQVEDRLFALHLALQRDDPDALVERLRDLRDAICRHETNGLERDVVLRQLGILEEETKEPSKTAERIDGFFRSYRASQPPQS